MSLLTKRFDLGHFNNMMVPMSKKYGLSVNEVEMILRSQWDFLYTEMKANELNEKCLPVKIKWLGKWYPNISRIRRKNENLKRYHKWHDKLLKTKGVEEGKQHSETDGSGKESHL